MLLELQEMKYYVFCSFVMNIRTIILCILGLNFHFFLSEQENQRPMFLLSFVTNMWKCTSDKTNLSKQTNLEFISIKKNSPSKNIVTWLINIGDSWIS